MSESQSFFKSTSYDFEQEVLARFRVLVEILPSECEVHRETWDSRTVICLDFQNCPYSLEIVKENVSILLDVMERFGLAKSIIFRDGNHLRAWRNLIKN
ncbi:MULTISPECIES: hypothetical protein [Cyanobacterium]|uniref:Uncharacterized protein n=1 Tax=Cyanobacterium aponinum 0216 TaxID=2676140 RepID=A0A844GXY5_9CHRO|nr:MULTISPECIES: hypothetical protein [Cyanobacterium]MTF39689.1 hypothetical protein [Cyanobacterium aponinum 0216]WVK99233.1 hypothetical protein Dongsha4_11060 [Cyanobacterium sp. Dongsha4]